MKVLKLQIPDQLAREIENLVRSGWFANEDEIARLALSEFVRGHRFELQEQFQREDIRWALDLKADKR
ncbi:MAG: CopG family transcriptional regulator [Thermoanaerobaculia bacterium]